MFSSLLQTQSNAVLALADGTFFVGCAIGAVGKTVGEVVFNTSMTGYQEILTDPSYCRQLVTLTYPHIGNYGVNDEDSESVGVQAAGLIIKDLPLIASNFRSKMSLDEFLRGQKTVAIAGIDTRELTRILRTTGAQNGCIVAVDANQTILDAHIKEAIASAQAASSMDGLDLAKEVSCTTPYDWTQGTWFNDTAAGKTGFAEKTSSKFKVVAYDFGVKRNILRMLVDQGCAITVVPATTPVAEVLAMKPDGVFLSNGPGDPAACGYAIEAAKVLIEKKLPVFGICLGHQILALASNAKTFKMRFGHHGGNHPVQCLETGRVSITSQNHGFAVDKDTLQPNMKATHVSLFDGTLQGFTYLDRPVFGFQGHPEASPGPHDIAALFERFTQSMAEKK